MYAQCESGFASVEEAGDSFVGQSTQSTSDGAGRVLVTGADGRIGRAVTTALAAAGRPVTGLALEWTGPSSADRLVTGDACDIDAVAEALDDVTAVVHTAAIPHPNLGTPYEVFRVNTTATFNVLDQAGRRGIRRAAIASSINAFGVPMNRHDVWPAYFPLDEELPVLHDDPYSLAKFTDEHTARMAHSRWGIDVVAFRLAHVRTMEEAVEASAKLTAGAGAEVRVAREGWSYIVLDDVVQAFLAALDAPLTGAHVVLLSADDVLPDIPTHELLTRFAPHVPTRAQFPDRTALVDTTRARELLGWAPIHSAHRPGHIPTLVPSKEFR